ncbi:MAG: hypothetical protein BGO43_12995 [Gammaproteobacteria bacterium 39-13]|nr:Sua5/YciO/YrdC/YwlC family protein [Gammaproteobacteria bacterium]OJV90733.1 MAG: hypothetical protein BGO43_12995 [Gammaproteobacteria bacterium 39-13]
MSFYPLSLEQSVAYLQQQKVIAYPTEAIFGLGCCPLSLSAIEALISLKQRDSAKGFILIASDIQQVLPYIDCNKISLTQWEKIQTSWPGPYTWVFPATTKVLPLIKGQHSSVAVRVTAHPEAKALCETFGGAIVSTSANVASSTPFRKGQDVFNYFGDKIAGVLAGEVGGVLNPTTIQDALTGEVYRSA